MADQSTIKQAVSQNACWGYMSPQTCKHSSKGQHWKTVHTSSGQVPLRMNMVKDSRLRLGGNWRESTNPMDMCRMPGLLCNAAIAIGAV